MLTEVGLTSSFVFSPNRKAATHDYEIQHLYEEMEQQIKKEKDRILLQVKPC